MTSEHHNHQHCIELFEKLSEYIDNELSEPECREIEKHIKECALCRVCLETLKRSVDICRHTQTRSMPTPLSKRINRLLQESMAEKNCESDH
jgi:anti-sigma factor RsiW